MKKTVRIFWRSFFTVALAILFFLGAMPPARAPMGNKKSMGGRSIASIQEEDFDKNLYRYQHCYGVKFRGENATQERRRACKAILVRSLEEALLQKPGGYFRNNVIFQCENTAMGAMSWKDKKSEDQVILALRPNHEQIVVDQAIQENLDVPSNVDPALEAKSRDVCGFYVDCKKAMRLESFSIRKIGSCLVEKDEYKRRVILNSISRLIFKGSEKKDLLVAEVLHGD